jgi:FixJ family two-component response regulator
MKSTGYVPEVFTSIDEFLLIPEIFPGGCVLADVQMRGGNGLELHRRLKKRGVSIPVILLTAYDTDELRAEAKRIGISGFFRKPIDDQALIDAIEWTVNQSYQ